MQFLGPLGQDFQLSTGTVHVHLARMATPMFFLEPCGIARNDQEVFTISLLQIEN